MLRLESIAVLLACVTSLMSWPLAHAQQLIYRGCAYRPVVGKEQALWFCIADNHCSMFHCRDNDVFSPDDCGCVPPRRKNVTQIIDSAGSVPASKPTTTPSVIHSGGGSIKTSSVQPVVADCEREIHIKGVSAEGSIQGKFVVVDVRGVVDLGNGTAYFDGYSSLAVPMYRNAAFQSGISMGLVVEEGTSTLRQVLVTNCKHGMGPSVEIIMDVDLGVILFQVAYRFRDAVNAVESTLQVAVPYTAFVPKRVVLVFDGRRLLGRVNDNERSVTAQGNGDYVLAQRPKPLMFGNTLCDVEDVYSYRGRMKQLA
nr:hypothetical protein BaRGS_025281 [Batillaria attramentaria]